MAAQQQQISDVNPWCAQITPPDRPRTTFVDNSERSPKSAPMEGNSPTLGTTRGRDQRHPQIAGRSRREAEDIPSIAEARRKRAARVQEPPLVVMMPGLASLFGTA